MNSENLTNIKESIEKMDLTNQKEILKIFKENNINISENNNGSFINLTSVNSDIIIKIEKYIEYFNKQQNNLIFIEDEKINIKNEFFYNNNNKNKKLNKSKEAVVDNI